MNDKLKVLTLMVERFQQKHGRAPDKIVIAPVALVALGLKRSVSPIWNGVPVECRLFAEADVATRQHSAVAKSIGVFVKENRGRLQLAACDLL